jgi:hypothetical protein
LAALEEVLELVWEVLEDSEEVLEALGASEDSEEVLEALGASEDLEEA